MLTVSSVFFICFGMSGCYNDKAEILYSSSFCDSATATYSTSVTAVLNQHCNSCHGGSASSGGGIVLDNYTSVKTYVINGKLMGSVNHTAGYSRMPQGNSKLDDCTIGKLQHWVAVGAPNN